MTGSKRKVLIIESDLLTVRRVEELLRSQGWETDDTPDWWLGRMLAQQQQPDVIVLDVADPKAEGYETFKELRESPATATIPIIALADGDRKNGIYYTSEDLEAAFNVPGPEMIVDKPVDPHYLMTCILGVAG